MDDFIFEAKQNQEVEINKKNEYYCVTGSQEFLDESNNPRVKNEDDSRVLAKRIYRDDGTSRLSIKLSNTGKIQNPLSIFGMEKQTTFLDRVCRSQNKFKEVNMKVFNFYLSFLRTKNVAWLHNAEREME
jgi:hypothetical protein